MTDQENLDVGSQPLPTFLEAGAPPEAHRAAYLLGATATPNLDGSTMLHYPDPANRAAVVAVRARVYPEAVAAIVPPAE